MEKRDLYDEKRLITGKVICKGETVPKGFYYLAVVIAIETGNHQFLIQKRAAKKGGMWANTAGHPKEGETSLEGIIREVKEELNLDISQEKINHFKTIQEENKFIDFYHVYLDTIENVSLQKEEVENYAIVSEEKLVDMMQNGNFLPSHTRMMKECFHYLKEKNHA